MKNLRDASFCCSALDTGNMNPEELIPGVLEYSPLTIWQTVLWATKGMEKDIFLMIMMPL